MSDTQREFAKPQEDKEHLHQLLNEDLSDELKQQFIQKINELYHIQPDLQNLRQYSDLILSPEYIDNYQGLNRIRKLLCQESAAAPNEQLIQLVIDSPAINRICEIALNNELNLLVYEAVWIIVNIGLGDNNQIDKIIQRNGIQILSKAAQSKLEQIVELACWGIGNFSSDSSQFAKMLIEANVIPPLIRFANEQKQKNQQFYKNSIWALSNIIRSGTKVKGKDINLFPTFFSEVIRDSDDEEILLDSLWALTKVSEEEQQLHKIYETGVTTKLIQLLSQKEKKILIPALRIIGNFLTGNDDLTQKILNHDILTIFEQLLNRQEKVIIVETCWSLSNISAGNVNQVKLILQKDSLMLKLFSLIDGNRQEIIKEINWILSNALSHGHLDDINHAVQLGLLKSIKILLQSDNKQMLVITLQGIKQLLKKSLNVENINYTKILTENGITEMIELLQSHPDNKVYKEALQILEEFFEIEEV